MIRHVVIVEFRRNAKKPKEAGLVPVLPVLHTAQYKANYATSALTVVYFKANDFAVKPGCCFFLCLVVLNEGTVKATNSFTFFSIK